MNLTRLTLSFLDYTHLNTSNRRQARGKIKHKKFGDRSLSMAEWIGKNPKQYEDNLVIPPPLLTHFMKTKTAWPRTLAIYSCQTSDIFLDRFPYSLFKIFWPLLLCQSPLAKLQTVPCNILSSCLPPQQMNSTYLMDLHLDLETWSSRPFSIGTCGGGQFACPWPVCSYGLK